LEVLGLVATGMASKDIADRLFISVNTVNNHRQRILEKLDSRSSAEAVRYVMKLGLI
jgi:DNA-binding CsgD family transcriptional regulator